MIPRQLYEISHLGDFMRKDLIHAKNLSKFRMNDIKVFILLLCVVAVFLVPTHLAHAFLLKVSLREAKNDSGKVTVYAYSHETGTKKSTDLNVGRIVTKTGNSNIENIRFTFSEKQLPPNGAFSACVESKSSGKTECEQADRHHNAQSAVIWIKVPS